MAAHCPVGPWGPTVRPKKCTVHFLNFGSLGENFQQQLLSGNILIHRWVLFQESRESRASMGSPPGRARSSIDSILKKEKDISGTSVGAFSHMLFFVLAGFSCIGTVFDICIWH